jgi:hypothetical protein
MNDGTEGSPSNMEVNKSQISTCQDNFIII